jgi:hypothetical protein
MGHFFNCIFRSALLLCILLSTSNAQTFKFKLVHERTDPPAQLPAHEFLSLNILASNGVHHAEAKNLLLGQEIGDFTWGPIWAPHPEGVYTVRIDCYVDKSTGLSYVQQHTQLETSLRVDNGAPPEILIRVLCPVNQGKLEQPIFIRPRAIHEND